MEGWKKRVGNLIAALIMIMTKITCKWLIFAYNCKLNGYIWQDFLYCIKKIMSICDYSLQL
jgi:hypothetical protein